MSMMSLLVFAIAGCGQKETRYGDMTVSEAFPRPKVRALAKAAAAGDVAGIDRALAAGVDVNATGQKGVTPLWWAIVVYNYAGFEHLLSRGANPNIAPAGDMSIMNMAAYAKDPRFLQAAIKAGGNVNLVGRLDGTTPIFWAILGRDIDRIKLLLEHGAWINYQKPKGITPLIAATDVNGFHMAYYLLTQGADPTIKTKLGYTIVWNIHNNQIDPKSDEYQWKQKVIELLKQKGMDVEHGK